MFWKKEPPKPWYKKLWSEWKQAILSITTVLGMAVGAYGYVAIDTSGFLNTTDIGAAANSKYIVLSIDVNSPLDETTYIEVDIDGQRVANYVYPLGLPEGNIVSQIDIPFTSDEEYVDLDVKITVQGLRTLFHPQSFKYSEDLRRENFDKDITYRSGITTVPFHFSSKRPQVHNYLRRSVL